MLARVLVACAALALAGPAHAADLLPPSEVQAAVQARAAELDGCYADALAIDADAAGSVTLRWTVDTQGAVSDIRFESGARWPDGFARCLSDAVRTLRFDPPPLDLATVEFPLRFRAGSSTVSVRTTETRFDLEGHWDDAPPPSVDVEGDNRGVEPERMLESAEVYAVFGAWQSRLDACYAQFAADLQTTQGRVILRLAVQPSGGVEYVEVAGTPFDARVAACALSVVERMEFPAADLTTEMVMPLTFP